MKPDTLIEIVTSGGGFAAGEADGFTGGRVLTLMAEMIGEDIRGTGGTGLWLKVGETVGDTGGD